MCVTKQATGEAVDDYYLDKTSWCLLYSTYAKRTEMYGTYFYVEAKLPEVTLLLIGSE